jgi:hypothetical protein
MKSLRKLFPRLPDGALNRVANFDLPRKNFKTWFPPLKIMETEDVTDELHRVFGSGEYMNDDWLDTQEHTLLPVIERVEQDGNYQIIHFRDNMEPYAHVACWDEFYVDLDRKGSLWIPHPTIRQSGHDAPDPIKERTEVKGNLKYYTESHNGCWQIQYADPHTPHRILTDKERNYPYDTVNYDFNWLPNSDGIIDKTVETGYVHSGPRPRVLFKKTIE